MNLPRIRDLQQAVDPVSRVFGIGILPSMCLIMTIFSWFLYRLTVMSYAITAQCVPMHEYWFPFRQGTWPLSGLFFFIVFLLIALHVVVLFSPNSTRKGDKFVLVIGILVLLYAMTPIYASMVHSQNSYYKENDILGDWLVDSDPSWWGIDDCEAAKPYLGKWKVVEKDVPWWGFQFPANWIELRSTLKYRASEYLWQPSFEGRWYPPGRRFGNFSGRFLDGYWEFKFDGEKLILTTPEWATDFPDSRVVLVRMSDEEAKKFDMPLK